MAAYVKNASVAPHLVDSRDPPAIALLKEDHQIFRALFDLIETIDVDLPADATESLARAGSPIDGEVRPERAHWVNRGRP